MSKYTTELRYICEMKSGFSEDVIKQKSVNEIITASRANIFNFNYPIYDSTYKPTLETKILKHYYTREIGAETYGLWHNWLDMIMNEIMPKYNKLYKAEREVLNKELRNIDVHTDQLRTDDLLKESDYTRTDDLLHKRDYTRTDNLTEQTDELLRNRYSDTPQGGIDWNDLEVGESGNVYLTDYRRIDDGTTRTNTGTQRNAGSDTDTGTQRNAGSDKNTGTQDFDKDEFGYRGNKTYAELLADYADNVLNIDLMIIKDLEDLFFKLW